LKSPYRKGINLTTSNAAIQAAAILVSNAYRSPGPEQAKRLVNIASDIIDEIEARQAMPEVLAIDEAA